MCMLNCQLVLYNSHCLVLIWATLLALQRLSNFGTCLSGALHALLPFADVGTVLVQK